MKPGLSEQRPQASIRLSVCPSQVSRAARQEKRFQDYNERCTFHHRARVSSGSAGLGGKSRGSVTAWGVGRGRLGAAWLQTSLSSYRNLL